MYKVWKATWMMGMVWSTVAHINGMAQSLPPYDHEVWGMELSLSAEQLAQLQNHPIAIFQPISNPDTRANAENVIYIEPALSPLSIPQAIPSLNQLPNSYGIPVKIVQQPSATGDGYREGAKTDATIWYKISPPQPPNSPAKQMERPASDYLPKQVVNNQPWTKATSQDAVPAPQTPKSGQIYPAAVDAKREQSSLGPKGPSDSSQSKGVVDSTFQNPTNIYSAKLEGSTNQPVGSELDNAGKVEQSGDQRENVGQGTEANQSAPNDANNSKSPNTPEASSSPEDSNKPEDGDRPEDGDNQEDGDNPDDSNEPDASNDLDDSDKKQDQDQVKRQAENSSSPDGWPTTLLFILALVHLAAVIL